MIATRDAYGKVLVELGHQDERIVVLDGDLWNSTKTEGFRKAFPHRFFDMGIAEQNMVGVASGLALCGKVPFVSTFACFLSRAWEHIRVSVCIAEANVKLVTTHGGITTGEDGHTAQMTEDIAIMRCLPHMTVIVPADAVETEKAIRAIVDWPSPVFVRLGRAKVPLVYAQDYQFQIGKADVVREGKDVSIFCCGVMVFQSLQAAEALAGEGIEAAVINVSTIKPLDVETICHWAKHTGAVVTAEEHQINGGLGSAIAEVLAENHPTPLLRVGMKDTFGESGAPEALLVKYGLTAKDVAAAARQVLQRKL